MTSTLLLLVLSNVVELDVASERPLRPGARSTGEGAAVASPAISWAIAVGRDAPGWTRAGLTPEEAARRHLLEHPAISGLDGASIGALERLRVHDLGHGPLIVSLGKRHAGVPVFRDALHVVMTRERELVAVTGSVSPAAPGHAAFRLTPETAVGITLGTLGLDAGRLAVAPAAGEGWLRVQAASGVLQSGRVRRVWYPLADALEPAWQVELGTSDDALFEVVSAWDGRVLCRKALTEHQQVSYRVWARAEGRRQPQDAPWGNGLTPHPTGQRSPIVAGLTQPSTLVSLVSGPSPRQDPWLPAGAVTLSGNNGVAYADLSPPFGRNLDAGLRDGGFWPDDPAPTTTSPATFDHAYDFAASPDAGLPQLFAATTHLFFTANWLHDVSYAAGFDEASGNAQADNFGRGGLGGDALDLSASSYQRPNNASMTTFADGVSPRMQMGNFVVSPSTFLDLSALDAGRVFTSTAGPTGPPRWDVTGRLVPMRSDGGLDGCGPLDVPGALAGAIAVASEVNCSGFVSAEAAFDAGALAVVVLPRLPNGLPSLFQADASVSIPVAGLRGTPPVLAVALDAGVEVEVRLVREPQPERPSALDSHIIAHEFGHALSNRLIADSAGLQSPISRSLGEGWSDFFALLVTLEEADAQAASNSEWSGAFGMGGWATGGTDALGLPTESAWFGIRRVTYSSDFQKNGLTFRHIRDGVALPPNARPNGLPNSQFHNAGEVWCSLLWEAFTGLLRARPFAVARDQMLELLVGGLKATPANPDFLEARDALLAVAFATDPQTFRVLFEGFARRGAGPNAVAPLKLSANNAPVIEDFSVTEGLRLIGASADDGVAFCDRDGVLDSAETGTLTLRARVTGTMPRSTPRRVTVRPLSADTVVLGDGTATFPSGPPFGVVQASVPIRLERGTDVRALEFQVDVEGASSSTPNIVTVLANLDEVPSATEDFERPVSLDRGTGWRRGDDLVLGTFTADPRWSPSPQTVSQTVMSGPNAPERGRSWLVTPALEVGPSSAVVRFRHRYQLEGNAVTAWDGAYLEVSEDGQQTWAPVPPGALSPTYPGAVSTTNPNGGLIDNPAAGSPAFVRTSPGYPAFVNQTVTLGPTFASKTIHLRFVIATDSGGGRLGWDLDDVEVRGLSTTPFTQRVPDRARCQNRAPIITATPPQRVAERAQVVLTASVEDPDGDPLTLSWVQRSGPSVEVMGDRFTAPTVDADTTLEFEVTARDAELETRGVVAVVVASVNTAPTLAPTLPAVVRGGQPFAIAPNATDEDGDALTVTFVQVRGALAKDLGDGRFEAPRVGEPDRMYFEVRASDGAATVTKEVDVGVEAVACGCSGEPGAPALLVLGLLLARAARAHPGRRTSWRGTPS